MAKDKASSVIFLDEIDKIVGPSTNQDSFRGRLEAELRNHWDDAIRESWDVVILGTTSSVDEVPKGVISRFTECIKVARVSSEAIRTLVLEQLDLPHSLSEANLRQISTRLAAVGPREVEYFVRALKRRAQSKLLKARYFRKVSGLRIGPYSS